MNVQRNLIEAAADEENVEDEESNQQKTNGKRPVIPVAAEGFQNDVQLQSKKMVLDFSENSKE